MKKLMVLFIVSVSVLMPHLFSAVMAQQVSENREQIPAVTRPEDQKPRDLPSAESTTPPTSLNSNNQGISFDQHKGSASRTLSYSANYRHNDTLTDIFTPLMATSKKKLSLGPAGMMMDSGLSYSLPFSQYFSAFASLQPSITHTVEAPQTIWAAGLKIPITKRVDGGQDLSLKLSTTMDQQYRPVFFFSINMMSLGRK